VKLKLTSATLAALLAAGLLAACDNTTSSQPAASTATAHTPPPAAPAAQGQPGQRSWLAGDHHVHSRFSVGLDMNTDPPTPIIAGDAIYPIPMNALMGRYHGLSWMVATDHGGPLHSKLNLEQAYPELLRSREAVPEVVQFFGMELDTAAADHSSIILPRTDDEAQRLFELESQFDWEDRWPPEPQRNVPELMLQALRAMDALEPKPVLFAHHPSRSARVGSAYGLDTPGELRDWNDTAPQVAVGMEGAPGHQASALQRDGSVTRPEHRGFYENQPTLGGFDAMTARLGGMWDSFLGEGRRWWITANSDSHQHYTEGGDDFWPGEYSKTWVYAEHSRADVLDGLRNGRIFVSTGDLVSELHFRASAGGNSADIGGTLEVPTGAEITLEIRFLDPDAPNFRGDQPQVHHVDLIIGDITGSVSDREADRNASTRVLQRWLRDEWQTEGNYQVIRTTLERPAGPVYLRLRGTNTEQGEPDPDPLLEDPWSDLWFYSNPVFVTPE
jgi:hypothetical protein